MRWKNLRRLHIWIYLPMIKVKTRINMNEPMIRKWYDIFKHNHELVKGDKYGK